MQNLTKMLKITDSNYDQYKLVFKELNDFIYKGYEFLFKSHHPVEVLNEFEKANKSLAKKSLRIGLLDMFSMIKEGMPENQKQELHQVLLNKNLPGLWELLSIVNDILAKVLKRGKIRNLDEWYVIKEILDTVDSEISDSDRKRLGEISAAFEIKKYKED